MAISRHTGRDIRDKVIDLLKNGGTDCRGNVIPDLNTAIDEVDTKRSETTPDIVERNITYLWGDNQKTPLIHVDMEDSETFKDESSLGGTYEYTMEVYKCNVTAMYQGSQSSKIHNYIETYIEGIIDVLDEYYDSNITWIFLTGTERSELYQVQNQTMKMGTCAFEIRIN
jgi:hypothetical protein